MSIKSFLIVRPSAKLNWIGLVAALLALVGFLIWTAPPAYAAAISVNSTADNLVAGDGFCTLREAITNANGNIESTGGDCVSGIGADTINVPAGTYILSIAGIGEDSNATGDLDINDDLIINGSGGASTIIDGGAIDRVFHVFRSTQAPGTVEMSNLTIRNGLTTSVGGGIYNNSLLTLNNSTISDNSAAGGGGIWNGPNVSMTINNSTISGNSTGGEGGGIFTPTRIL